MARDPSAEGTGRKGTSLYDKTFCSLLNLTQLRTLKYQNFDLAPPSGKKNQLKSVFWIFRDLRRNLRENYEFYGQNHNCF